MNHSVVSVNKMTGELNITTTTSTVQRRDDVLASYFDEGEVLVAYDVFAIIAMAYIPIVVGTNILVIWGIVLYPGFHTVNNYLIVNLCVSDLLIGGFAMPMFVLAYTHRTQRYIFGNRFACLLWFASIEFAGGGSLWSLFSIAVDRYLAVMRPLSYNSIVTTQTVLTSIFSMWGSMALFSLLPMMGWNQYSYKEVELALRCNFFKTLPPAYVFLVLMSKLACIITCAVIYSQIIWISYKQVQLFREQYASMSTPQIAQFESRVSSIKITSCLMFLFILLWLPNIILAPIKYYEMFNQETVEVLHVASRVLQFGNSLVNAPVFAIGRHEYRQVYTLMLTTTPRRWSGKLKELHVRNYSNTEKFERRLRKISRKMSVSLPRFFRPSIELGSTVYKLGTPYRILSTSQMYMAESKV